LRELETGACQICGRVEPLVFDHDSHNGLVRGSLCVACNLRLPKIEGNGGFKPHEHFDYLYRKEGGNWHEGRFDGFDFSKRMQAILHIRFSETITLNRYQNFGLSCSRFHDYLKAPPLAPLKLKYWAGMKI